MNAVAVERSLYDDVVAFVRTMVGTCDGCFRRGIQCIDCDLRVSKDILSRLEKCVSDRHVSSDPFIRRCVDILNAVRDSDVAIRARDIEMTEYCTKLEKYRAILHLIRAGLVETSKDERGQRLFFVPSSMELLADAIIARGDFGD